MKQIKINISLQILKYRYKYTYAFLCTWQIKNQGSCGSCWAFAATGALEAQHKRINNQLVYMSEQQLIDCSWNYGNRGCNGGHPNYAFKYVSDAGGICSKNSYPYLGYVSKCIQLHVRTNTVALACKYITLFILCEPL